MPCYVHGAPYDGTTLGCLFMPAAVRLEFGEPIDVSAYLDGNNPRGAPEELTRRALREIAQLAGQPDFKPQVGGRSD